MVSKIYPSELQLNKANTSDTKAAFLDLHLSISNDIVYNKIKINVTTLIWKLSISHFYTPPLKCGEVLCYTLRCLSVRPSVRAHHFRSITWVFIHGIFSNFAYILLSGMSGMGLLMGKIRPFLTELLPFFVLEKWFLACYSFTVHDIWMKLHRYVAHQRLHIVTKDRHSDLPSLWVIRPW